MLGLNQSGKAITLRLLSLADHLEFIEAARDFCVAAFAEDPANPRIGNAGSAIHRHRPHRIPGQVMTRRKMLLWLAAVAVLALLVAYQTLGSSAARHADEFAARADVPTVPPGADVLLGVNVVPKRSHRFDYRRSAFGDAWDDDNDAPGGHNGCDTRDDILNRDLVDVTYVFTKRCPNAVATGTLHDPYTNAIIAFQRGAKVGEAVQIDHIVPLAYAWDMGACELAGPASGCDSPTIRPTCWPCRGRPIRTRATRRRRGGCRPTPRSRVSTPCSSSPCCVATRCRWTRHRPTSCVRPPAPARRDSRARVTCPCRSADPDEAGCRH